MTIPSLHVRISGELLWALDARAAFQKLNRSEVVRLALQRLLNAPEEYIAPSLPNWQVAARTALLRGLFGVQHLVLSDNVRNLLEGAVGALDERQARVLRLRFGLDGPRYTLAEVGAIMSITRERVRQIEVLALARVRGWCRGRGIWDLLKGQLELDENIR